MRGRAPILVLAGLLLAAMGGELEAQGFDFLGTEAMMQEFQTASRVMAAKLFRPSMWLVGGLFALEMGVWGFRLLKGRVELKDVALNLMQKGVLFIGIVFVVGTWSVGYVDFFGARMIVSSFEELGLDVSGLPSLDIASVLGQGVRVAFLMLGAALKGAPLLGHPAAAGLFLFPAVVIMVSYGVLAVAALYHLLRAKVAIGVGGFFTAFAASRFTAGLAEGYYRFVLSSAIRIFAIYFVLGVWGVTSQLWVAELEAAIADFDAIRFMGVTLNGVVWSSFYAFIAFKLPGELSREIVTFQAELGLRSGITAES